MPVLTQTIEKTPTKEAAIEEVRARLQDQDLLDVARLKTRTEIWLAAWKEKFTKFETNLVKAKTPAEFVALEGRLGQPFNPRTGQTEFGVLEGGLKSALAKLETIDNISPNDKKTLRDGLGSIHTIIDAAEKSVAREWEMTRDTLEKSPWGRLRSLAGELIASQAQNNLARTRNTLRSFQVADGTDEEHKQQLPATKELLEEYFRQPEAGAVFMRSMAGQTWDRLQEIREPQAQLEARRNAKRFEYLAAELNYEYLKKPEARLTRHLAALEDWTLDMATHPSTYRARTSYETNEPKTEEEFAPLKARINEMVRLYCERFGQASDWTPERKAAFRAIARAAWPLADIFVPSKTGKSHGRLPLQHFWQEQPGQSYELRHSLDSKACDELLRLGGIKTQAWSIEGGGTRTRSLILNSGDVEGVQYDRERGMLMVDHHGEASGIDTGASQYFYEVLRELGLFDDDIGRKVLAEKGTTNEILEYALAFTALDDNKSHPAWQQQKSGWWENEGPYTILGLTARLEFGDLLATYRHLEQKGIPGSLWDTYRLMDDDIKTLKLEAQVETQEKTVVFARRMWDDLAEHGYVDSGIPKEEGERAEKTPRRVFRLPSKKYGTVVLAMGAFPAGIDALRGLGGRDVVIVNYNPQGGSLFVSRAGAELPSDLFPQVARGKEKIDRGHVVRNRMWLYSPSMSTERGEEGSGEEGRRGADFPFTIGEVCEKLGVSYEDFLALFPLQDEVAEEAELQARRENLPVHPEARLVKKIEEWFRSLVQEGGRGFALGKARRAYQQMYERDVRLGPLGDMLGQELNKSFEFYEKNWPGYLRQEVEGYLAQIEAEKFSPGDVLRKLRRLRDQDFEVEIEGKKYAFGDACHIIAVVLETDGAWAPQKAGWDAFRGRLGRVLIKAARKEIEASSDSKDLPADVKDQLVNSLIARAQEALQED